MAKRRPTPRDARKVKEILDGFATPKEFTEVRALPAPTPKRCVGRPSIYCEEVVTEICFRLGLGESLVTICDSDGLPDYATVMRWLAKRDANGDAFRDRYVRAREASADKLAGEIIELADTSTPENYNAVKNRVDARKWVAAKLKPKVYGERIQQDVNATVSLGDLVTAAIVRKPGG
jgi:terminase small subunit-like protein